MKSRSLLYLKVRYFILYYWNPNFQITSKHKIFLYYFFQEIPKMFWFDFQSTLFELQIIQKGKLPQVMKHWFRWTAINSKMLLCWVCSFLVPEWSNHSRKNSGALFFLQWCRHLGYSTTDAIFSSSINSMVIGFYSPNGMYEMLRWDSTRVDDFPDFLDFREIPIFSWYVVIVHVWQIFNN